MKVLLEVKDNKADFLMELLNSFSFVKTNPLSTHKAQVLGELKEAVDNMNLVKEGKLKPKPARVLFEEL
jgi:hypothetical protein